MKEIYLYTDGSCLKNPGGPGGCAYILEYEIEGKRYRRRESFPEASTTNNRQEILAVLHGFRHIHKRVTEPAKVFVFTDSQYVADAFSKHWIDKWEKQEWKRGKELAESVKNADLWSELLPLVRKYDVTFKWIRGHNGHIQNEICDDMAVQAAKSQVPFCKFCYLPIKASGSISDSCKTGIEKEGAEEKQLEKEDADIVSKEKKLKRASDISNNTDSTSGKKGKSFKLRNLYSVETCRWSDIDIKSQMKKKEFTLVPTASHYDGEIADAKILLAYGGMYRIYSNHYMDCVSANEALLKIIREGITHIKFAEQRVNIITGCYLGFRYPGSSAHRTYFEEIDCLLTDSNNRLYVSECTHEGDAKLLKRLILELEKNK